MWKTLWRLTLLLTLCVIGILAWVTLSPSGTHWALSQANKHLDSLTIEGVDGRLYDGVQLQSLHFQSADTRVQAELVRTAWQPSCLLQKKLCLENISIETLELDLPAAVEPPPPEQAPQPFSIPALPLELELNNASIESLTWTQDGTTQSLQGISLSVQAQQNSIEIVRAALTWQENQAELSATLELSEHYPLKADLSLALPSLLGPQASELTLQAQGLLDGELNLDAQLIGHQQATLTGSVHALEQPLRLEGKLFAQRLQTLETNNPAALLEDFVLSFSGDLQQLKLDSQSRFSGAQIPPSSFRLSALMQDLAQLDKLQLDIDALGGQSKLEGQLSWKDELSWQLQGGFDAIDISQLREDVSGSISGELISRGEQRDGEFISPETTATAHGKLQGRPLNADLALTLAPKGYLELQKLELHSGKNHLSAQGKIDQELRIDAHLKAPELATLWPGLGGSIHGDIRASGSTDNPNIQADLVASTLVYQDFSTEQLTLKAQINDGGNQHSSVALKSTGISASGLEQAAVDAQWQGKLSQHQLQLAASTEQQSAKVQLAGSLTQNDWLGTLNTALLSHEDIKVQLEQPTAIAWYGNKAEAKLAAHCWVKEATSLCLKQDSTVSANAGDSLWELSNLKLKEFNKYLPENTQLGGTLKTVLHGQWTDGATPIATIDSNIDKLSLKARDANGDDVSVNFTTAKLSATLGDQQGQLDLQLSSPEQGDSKIKASIDPITKALTGSVDLSGFLLKPLQPLIPMLDTLRGEISAKGNFSGSLEDPQFKGRIQLKNPAIAGAEVPLTIDGGQLKLDIDGRNATINAEFLTKPSGSLSISGDIAYQETLIANIALNGDALPLILPPTVDATVNHSLTLAFTPELLKLRGKVHIPEATITLEGMSSGGPTLSKDLVLVDEEDQPKELEQQAGPLQIDMDVEVQVDDDVRLSGYGFDTRLKGDIKVRQRVGQPAQLAGELSLEEGKYQAYGQDLEVRRGELLFVGPIGSTRVDVQAVRVVDDIEAGLMLSGALLSPEASLFSEPAMSDSIVLSYILLGAPPGQGSTGGESAMLARAALGLGLKNGNRIAGQFASAAGIEDFNIGADGRGDDTAVVLSGRLSPKLLLSYRMGIFDAANTLTARYDLSQALYVELIEGVEQAIDLFYTVDY